MQREEGIGMTKGEDGTVAGSQFWLKEGIVDPGSGLMTVDVLGNDIEGATDHRGNAIVLPLADLRKKPFHPGEFVLELLRADRIAVGQINDDDADARNHNLRCRACVSASSRESAWLADSMDDLERIATPL